MAGPQDDHFTAGALASFFAQEWQATPAQDRMGLRLQGEPLAHTSAEAADIVSSARDEAERLAREAQEKMTDFVKRRTATAEAKIAQAEAQASAEVRAAAVDAAIKASERVLRDEITGATAASLMTASLNDVRTKLQ